MTSDKKGGGKKDTTAQRMHVKQWNTNSTKVHPHLMAKMRYPCHRWQKACHVNMQAAYFFLVVKDSREFPFKTCRSPAIMWLIHQKWKTQWGRNTSLIVADCSYSDSMPDWIMCLQQWHKYPKVWPNQHSTFCSLRHAKPIFFKRARIP